MENALVLYTGNSGTELKKETIVFEQENTQTWNYSFAKMDYDADSILRELERG